MVTESSGTNRSRNCVPYQRSFSTRREVVEGGPGLVLAHNRPADGEEELVAPVLRHEAGAAARSPAPGPGCAPPAGRARSRRAPACPATPPCLPAGQPPPTTRPGPPRPPDASSNPGGPPGAPAPPHRLPWPPRPESPGCTAFVTPYLCHPVGTGGAGPMPDPASAAPSLPPERSESNRPTGAWPAGW